MTKPIFTLVAGINGAGKSTCYDMMGATERENLGTRINIDELALKYGDIVVGGKAALHLKAKCFADNLSFHQETTFTGRTILKSIDDAKAKGYAVNLIYVCVYEN
jgi:predicted ABC-type ATPase